MTHCCHTADASALPPPASGTSPAQANGSWSVTPPDDHSCLVLVQGPRSQSHRQMRHSLWHPPNGAGIGEALLPLPAGYSLEASACGPLCPVEPVHRDRTEKFWAFRRHSGSPFTQKQLWGYGCSIRVGFELKQAGV